jgi:hypothetical protein
MRELLSGCGHDNDIIGLPLAGMRMAACADKEIIGIHILWTDRPIFDF